VSPQPRKRQPPARPVAAKRPRAGTAKKPRAKPAEPPGPAAEPASAAAAAIGAIDIAAHVTPAQAPVAVPTQFPLDTGLVDYGMWVEMFERNQPPPVPPGPFRRGRIWA
jgi:cyanobactin cluster PatC/TenC/TruC protein